MLATVSVISIGVIACLYAQRPPFGFIPTSEDLIHWGYKPRDGNRAFCSFYSFSEDFNSICLRADAELLSLGYKEVRLSMDNPDETRRYDTGRSDTGRERVVVLRKNLIPVSGRVDSSYSVRVGWVTIEIDDYRPYRTLLQRLVNKLKNAI
jgi:hypothetical protein